MFNLIKFFFIRIKAKRDAKFIEKHSYLLITGNNNDILKVGVVLPGIPLIDIQEKVEVFNNESNN